MKKVFVVLFLSACCFSQQLKPSEQEGDKLAKLKAQNESLQSQINQIDTQIQALNLLKQMKNEQQQQKYSEYLGLANKIKEDHKDWGQAKDIDFNPVQGESGSFSRKKVTKDNDQASKDNK